MIKKQALEQFRSGKSLTGKGGAFAPLFKQFLEAALQAELEDHLSSDDPDEALNRKNGKVSKTVKTSDGEVDLVTSRDRNGSFELSIIKKRETILADSLQDRIIGMYGIGMSLRDISNHIIEMYDMDISHDTSRCHYRAYNALNKREAKQTGGGTLLHSMDGRYALQSEGTGKGKKPGSV